ncbi:MAG: carboxypeptidase-like regulatory domain-containing protein [Rhodothermales bacterium]
MRSRAAKWILLIAAIAVRVCCVETVLAQRPNDAPGYSFTLAGAPLSEALRLAIDEMHIDIAFESRIVAGKRAFCAIRNAAPAAALRCILAKTGLDYVQLSNGAFVIIESSKSEPLTGEVAGLVLDADTGAPLADASVLLPTANVGTATNNDGRFALADLKPGPYPIVVTHIAYDDAADTVWVDPSGIRFVNLRMTTRVVSTQPVVINGLVRRLPSNELGIDVISPSDHLETEGQADALDGLSSAMGIQNVDALSDLHVQGGDSGDHLYTLDGAKVFVPIRNGGIIGPFSPLALKQITVHKAGFEAGMGSSLSGVVSAEHLVGRNPSGNYAVRLDPLSVNARLSGSVGRQGALRADYLVAGRRSVWNLFHLGPLETQFRRWSIPNLFLLDVLEPGSSEDRELDDVFEDARIDLHFYDVHAAMRVRRNDASSLFMSFYRGQNGFSNGLIESEGDSVLVAGDDYKWTNQTAQVRYERVIGTRVFAQLGSWISSYALDHPFVTTPLSIGLSQSMGQAAAAGDPEFNRISEAGIRLSLDAAIAHRHSASASIEVNHVDSDFALSIDPMSRAPLSTPSTLLPIRWTWHASAQDDIALGLRTTLTLGSRITWVNANRRFYSEPRIAIRHDVPSGSAGSFAFRLAGGRYRQYVDQYDVSPVTLSALIPTFRFWIPTTKGVEPAESYHVTGDVLWRPTSSWELRAETFYKNSPIVHLLDYGSLGDEVPGDLTIGNGYAFGGGASARHGGRWYEADIGYDFNRIRTRVANRFSGNYEPAPWEVPHQITAGLSVRPARGLALNLRWSGAFGRTWAFRRAYYDYLALDNTGIYGRYNLHDPASQQLPAYSRLDAGLRVTGELQRVRIEMQLSALNVLGTRNVVDWGLERDDGRLERFTRTSTPFLPLLAVQVVW